MANFTRTIKFTAFQFVPEQLAGVDPYDIEDLIRGELGSEDVDIKSAHINEHGKLSVVFYGFTEGSKTYFEIDPFDWVTIGDSGKYELIKDEKFKEIATPTK